jgi:outer membrane immunogenic protein
MNMTKESDMYSKRLWLVVVIGSFAFGGIVGSASAQSVTGDLSGFYVGAQAGYGWGEVDWSDADLTSESVSHDANGALGGVYLGYQHDMSDMVLGVERSFSFANLEDEMFSAVNPADVSYETEIDMIATATARIGFQFDNLMPFARAGYAGADVEVRGTNTGIGDAFRNSNWEHGWTAGAGLEYRLTNQIMIGAEYSYTDLGKTNRSGSTDLASSYAISDVDTQIQAVVARVSYRFAY